MTVSRRAVLGAFGALSTTAALAACSTGSTSSSSPSATGSSTGTSDAGAFPVTIKNSFGNAVIPKEPTRIATLPFANEDYLAVLGVVPVLVPKWEAPAGNSRGSTDWFDAAVKKLGKDYPPQYSFTDSTPIDEIAKSTPDLLFGPYSGLTEQEYAKASKLAPTVAAPGAPYGATWQQILEIAGQATGKEAQAATAKTDLEKQIADAVAKYPAIKGKTIAVLRFLPTDTSKIFSTTTLDPRTALMLEFGFTTPQFVTDLSKANPQSYGAAISAEKAASTIDADVAIIFSEKDSDFDALKSNALLSKIPNIQNDTAIYLANNSDTNALNTPTVLSIPVVLEKYLPQLGAAAEKAK
ncbi:iron complex transport system substrate-binding protein [Branchiibius hedensis]|uniref:Iron complex transport system substrate-binding protein n=1 Tax=Branchiibius hedensis TaxID=672460 RepID=A0A2Y8ZUU2_9MICO|nr:ABC transporter substrate-binding protein [Branchiibius hedensis]PWJ27369.1 iron complex transport system substrate-binding protein [Branchiibius hedensis]SSA36180.1 iron complex transport system substrate-binding protein [Branchiibius hedensis]